MLKLLCIILSTSQTLLNIWRTSQNSSTTSTTAVECQMPPYGDLKLTLPTFGVSTCCFAVHRLFDSHSPRPGIWQLYSTWAIHLELSTVIPVIGKQRTTWNVRNVICFAALRQLLFWDDISWTNWARKCLRWFIHAWYSTTNIPSVIPRPNYVFPSFCATTSDVHDELSHFELVCAGPRQNWMFRPQITSLRLRTWSTIVTSFTISKSTLKWSIYMIQVTFNDLDRLLAN